MVAHVNGPRDGWHSSQLWHFKSQLLASTSRCMTCQPVHGPALLTAVQRCQRLHCCWQPGLHQAWPPTPHAESGGRAIVPAAQLFPAPRVQSSAIAMHRRSASLDWVANVTMAMQCPISVANNYMPLASAGVQTGIVPRFMGYGWILCARSRHLLRSPATQRSPPRPSVPRPPRPTAFDR